MAKECAILPFGIIKYQKPPIGEILMKSKAVKWLDIVIESINYIIVNYALSNMAMLFQSSLLFILFFASEVWVTTNYWSKANELSKNKVVSTVLLFACYIIHIALIYFVGRIVGDITPFKQ